MSVIPDYPIPPLLDGTELLAAWSNGGQAAVSAVALAKFILASLTDPPTGAGFLIDTLNADGQRIINLPAPSAPTDAARLMDLADAISDASSASIQASEVISAGDAVNIYLVSGAMRLRRALASDPTRFASGFAPAAIPLNTVGRVTFSGINAHAADQSTASEVWLSDTTPGAYTLTAPATDGFIQQSLGIFIPHVGIQWSPKQAILL